MNNYENVLREIQNSLPNLDLVAHELVGEGFDINEMQGNRSLLDQAVLHKQPAICQLLVETKKIKQTLLNKALSSAFSKYLKTSQISHTIIEILLKAGAQPSKDIIPDTGFAILDYSFDEGIKLLELLLAYGANVNTVQTEHGYNLLTMIYHATNKDFLSSEERQVQKNRLCELLLHYKINPELTEEGDGKTALMTTAEAGDIQLAQRLLDYDADITMEDYGGLTIIDYGRRAGIEDFFITVFKRLYGEKITVLAMKKETVDIEEHTIKIDKQNESLWYMALQGNMEEANHLLTIGADPNYKSSQTTILCDLVHRGVTVCGVIGKKVNPLDVISEMITQFLLAGADINLVDKEGNTPLHLVQYPMIAQLLINHGADIMAKNARGETVLYTAIKNTWSNSFGINILETLLKQKVDPNEKNSRGQTGLHLAVLIGQEEIIQVLLDHEADIDAQDIYGKTPLHRAVQKGNREIIELLLERGANPGIRCLLGKATWDYVYVTEEVKTLLLDANKKYEDLKKKTDVEEADPSTEKRARRDDQEQRVSTSSSSVFHARPSSSAASMQTNTQVEKSESEQSKNQEATESASPSSPS